MLCRMTVTVDHFSQLQAGDQISLPGRIPVLGKLYDHHAVIAKIEDVSDDGQTAKLTVFDVDEKGKPGICFIKPLPIKEHWLYDKEMHRLSSGCFKLTGSNAVVVRKVVYRRRKFDQSATVQRARLSLMNKGNTYSVCSQNCEHFACSLVNGPDDIVNQSHAESISVQGLDLVWIFLSVYFWSILAAFYGFNFWMFAVFVKKDSDFEFLSDNNELKDFLNKTCYAGESSLRYLQTTCDWKLIGICLGIFSLLFLLIVLFYYLPLYKKKYICAQCFVTVGINLFFSRLFSFAVVEIVHILAERPLYELVTGWKMNRFATILMLAAVCAGGAVFVYTLASIITKFIVWCCGLCSDSMKGYHHFVHLKGFTGCLCKLRCCCKDAKRKNIDVELRLIQNEII